MIYSRATSASIKVYDWGVEKSPEELQTTRKNNTKDSQEGRVALKEVSSMASSILLLLLLTLIQWIHFNCVLYIGIDRDCNIIYVDFFHSL